MPFLSKSQRRFMYAKHPEMAREWESKTDHSKPLPEHVKHAFDKGFQEELKKFLYKKQVQDK